MFNDRQIIAVNPVENLFTINWRMDIRCNYDCIYCKQEWHSKTSPVKSLIELQSSWKKMYAMASSRKLPIQLNILGGEPTVNQNLIPFVEWLFENYGHDLKKVGVATNGSAPLKIYIKLMHYLHWISFSVHSEFFNEKTFFSKILNLRKSLRINTGKRIDVTIMDEPWNRDRFETYKKILDKYHIDFKIVPINWNYATRTIPIINSKNQLIY